MFNVYVMLFLTTKTRNGTGCIFCFVNSKVKIGRIGKARACLTTLRKHVKMSPLYFTRFPCTKVIAAFSKAGNIASSTTKKATLTANDGATGKTVKITISHGASIIDITRRTGTSKGTINITADISVSRTAPTSFCTRIESQKVCRRVKGSLVTANFSFCTNSSFLGPRSGGLDKSASLCRLYRRSNCGVAHKCTSCVGGDHGTNGVVLLRARRTYEGSHNDLPCTVSHKRGSLDLPRVAETTMSFLDQGSGSNFFLVIRNNGVS